ncbi:unnamed protein product [Lasius platythorax]|uniref:Uncharacterized protein n=1 Tax=Lasius platythorax TaxID=488582 RepID=A0AAV2MZ57_9HYME
MDLSPRAKVLRESLASPIPPMGNGVLLETFPPVGLPDLDRSPCGCSYGFQGLALSPRQGGTPREGA